jgi:hypothetical protein
MSQYIVEFFTTMPLVWTLLSFAHRLTMCSVLPFRQPCIQFSPLLTSGSYVGPWVPHISAPYPLLPCPNRMDTAKKSHPDGATD